ncbi:unnamed protein product [Ectocarpus sp. CCAP 1310/34]|nr:unnamed protein product [Ectocarpus sp. CCAP 1310/34]
MDTSVHEVKPKKGEVWTQLQSRMVLMLLFDLRKEGRYENEAVLQVARTFKIGHDKVRRIINHWWDHRQLYETTADRRGRRQRRIMGDAASPKSKQINFASSSTTSTSPVVKSFAARWQNGCTGLATWSSHPTVRIKTPPLNAERLVEMDMAKRAENAGLAVIVYTDESFVHQAHGSPYSYFPSDENGVVQDGIGRKTRKGLRMSMVHAITKWGALAKFCDGFPIEEGWFKETGSGKNTMGDEETAEFLWQAKLAKGDFHAAMTDSMFMERLEHRLSPACNAIPDQSAGTNTKEHNVHLLRMFGAKSIRVKRKEVEQGVVEHNFEVPTEPGPSFPAGNREGGVSRAEVATVPREYIRLNHPERLVVRVVTFMKNKHGKQYVSLNFELKRKRREVWVQIRKGWHGDKEWPGQEGGWKAVNCSKLIDHAIGETNKWVKDRDGLLSGTIGNLNKPDGYDTDDVSPVGHVEKRVGEQIKQESAEWCDGSDEVEP